MPAGWNEPLTKTLGRQTANALATGLDVHTVCDLLRHYPRRYAERGELTDLEHTTFKDLDQVEIVGVFPNYASAHAAWKAKAQQTVDNAHMRYFVVHLHRLLDPGQDTKSSS